MKKIILFILSLLFCFSSFAQPIIDFYDECIEPERNGFSSRYLCNSEE